jgi:maleate isomerase
MKKSTDVAALEKKLDDILATLLRESQGSRCTVRMDDPVRGWHIDFICAEALRPGVKSLRGEGSIDQRAAATVKWMTAEKRNLVQPDLTGSPIPAPPPALMSAYAAKAQMLAPLFTKDGALGGFVSVHCVDGTRAFTAEEEGALNRAAAEVARLVGIGSQEGT